MKTILAIIAVAIVAALVRLFLPFAPEGYEDSPSLIVTRVKAEQNNAHAEVDLGLMYYKGQGVTQDYAEAMKWFRKAAEQGDYKAKFNLSLMYREGMGVARDDNEAANWMEDAATRPWPWERHPIKSTPKALWQQLSLIRVFESLCIARNIEETL